ncbi:Hint domain-containing protein [Ruegeria aquimaris]|uniref:Hint domain-containing protein n=1 Tax=Ruegeria aquimaris TaxID=2984333 RepID=A0ABT3AGL1_9RHOB|nr:Hint domain-containing protein [Ruegeria sp. XHP0148]MCV2887326.1 Hint domain-containing protein [Ruegeria sp. XHP0148]
MSWIAVSAPGIDKFSPDGLTPRQRPAAQGNIAEEDLMVRGTLVFETRLPNANRPRFLLQYERQGAWPFHLSLQAIPGGGLILIVNQGGSVLHQVLNVADSGRLETLRLSYAWDAPARAGWIALEHEEREFPLLVQIDAPSPLRTEDLRALFTEGGHRFVSQDLVCFALSDRIEPVGPMPSLLPDTPIATPTGYRELRNIQRGDTVIAASGDAVPVLHKVSRTVPAFGSTAPLTIRRPYFGLRQNIVVAPSQRLLLSGTEVEYLFGREAVLVSARHLAGGHSVMPARAGLTITYSQLLLPSGEAMVTAGTLAESLYIGRLHRRPLHLAASVLAGCERSRLPDHGRPSHMVLRSFDARILAEARAA